MSEVVTQLSDSLYSIFQSETFVLLNTVDQESGGPTSSAISWVYAVDHSKLRLALDHRSRLVGNLKANPRVTVTVFGQETIYAINGRATVVQDPLDGVPFNMCCFDIQIDAVRNALFYGAQLVSPPEYAKVYDQRAADMLDRQVFEAMKKPSEVIARLFSILGQTYRRFCRVVPPPGAICICFGFTPSGGRVSFGS
ncbi:hypothetical protein HMSSN139_38120 [Paenibacillus sp. HMSSN-139]|nr:hypothetical protein HMSSN139_38120 [Paenibacillus sp. HMSSN-139]